jgi:hypothetical protein
MNNEAIGSTIDSLKAIYTVLLALSLGEAFSQLVENPAELPKNGQPHRVIRWDRLPNLIPFLLLIIPFVQGMDRYFFVIYKTQARPVSYAGHLLLDCVVFTLEGSLFFILARSLSLDRWQRFYGAVISVLGLDALWGLTVFFRFHPPAVGSWIILDVVTCMLVGALMIKISKESWTDKKKKSAAAIAGVLIILLRTVADYYLSWNFYFPPS